MERNGQQWMSAFKCHNRVNELPMEWTFSPWFLFIWYDEIKRKGKEVRGCSLSVDVNAMLQRNHSISYCWPIALFLIVPIIKVAKLWVVQQLWCCGAVAVVNTQDIIGWWGQYTPDMQAMFDQKELNTFLLESSSYGKLILTLFHFKNL